MDREEQVLVGLKVECDNKIKNNKSSGNWTTSEANAGRKKENEIKKEFVQFSFPLHKKKMEKTFCCTFLYKTLDRKMDTQMGVSF